LKLPDGKQEINLEMVHRDLSTDFRSSLKEYLGIRVERFDFSAKISKLSVMKLNFLTLLLLMAIGTTGDQVHAFEGSSYAIGWSPLFANTINRVTSQDSAKSSVTGTAHYYPIQMSATFQLGYESYLQPFMTFSLLPRKNSSGDISESLLLLGLRYGKNFGFASYSGGMDWSFGTGIWQSTIKGSGTDYADGSGTLFYNPNSSTVYQAVFTSGGIGYETSDLRMGSDLVVLNLLNNKKRSYNVMFNFSWKGRWL
jgi:hypothetical protein